MRDRFSGELQLDLEKRFEPGVVTQVLDRLQSRGILNDARVVQALVLSNTGKKAIAASVLRAKCEARGASEDALALIDASFTPPLDVLLARFDPVPPNRARAARFLASRGFEEEAIEAALDGHFGARD